MINHRYSNSLAGCLIILSVLLAGGLLFATEASANMPGVVVLPFNNLAKNQDLNWIGEGLPELLEERLRTQELNVLGREERLVAFDRIGIPYSSALSKASLIKVGMELDANFMVMGSFSLADGKLRVSASLMDLDKPSMADLEVVEGSIAELQSLSNGLAWQIVKIIQPEFPGSKQAFSQQFPPIPPAALESYIRGVMESDLGRQIHYFREAERAMPDFPRAIYELGRIYYREKDYATSALWLQRLDRRAAGFAEAAFLLGLDYLYLKSYDKASVEFKRLAETIPVDEVYSNLGIALSRLGKTEEAVWALRKGASSELADEDCLFNLAYHYWKTGNTAAALKSSNEVLKMNPQDAEACFLQYKSLEAMGRSTEASAALSRAKALNPKVEIWESRNKAPDLFRVLTDFNEASYRQLLLEIQQATNHKPAPSSGLQTGATR